MRHDINSKSGCVKKSAFYTQATFSLLNIRNRLPKRPYGLFGTKPDMASAFIRIMAVIDAKALAGIAMPAWASAFSSKMYKIALNANVLAGIAKPARASASISVNIIMSAETNASIVPKGP